MTGLLVMTGVAIKMPAAIAGWSGGNVPLILLLTMVVSLILGCGLPASAAYLMVAIMVAPVLIRLGMGEAQAHLFVLFYAVIAYVTPPVAMASLVASKIAGAPFWATSIEAAKAASGSFIIPFLFVYYPILLLMPMEVIPALLGIISSLIMLISLQIFVCNQYINVKQLSILERALSGGIVLALFINLFVSNFIIFALATACFTFLSIEQWRKRRRLILTDKLLVQADMLSPSS